LELIVRLAALAASRLILSRILFFFSDESDHAPALSKANGVADGERVPALQTRENRLQLIRFDWLMNRI